MSITIIKFHTIITYSDQITLLASMQLSSMKFFDITVKCEAEYYVRATLQESSIDDALLAYTLIEVLSTPDYVMKLKAWLL